MAEAIDAASAPHIPDVGMQGGPRVRSLPEAMTLAMEQGLRALGSTSPNPPVGAVIIDDAGRVVGVGHTQPPGGPHAEVMALRAAGNRARGATAVVTLEPCNHTGRTGPCALALIAAGVARVRYLHPDPNPQAAGGAETLNAGGIDTLHAPLADRLASDGTADALAPWLTSVKLGRPHVTLKFAQTLDGFTAAQDGTSQWITGERARAHVHADRASRDAIIIGTGTALADNPSLTARRPDGSLRENQPRRVVIGSRTLAPQDAPNLHELGFEQYDGIGKALDALYESGARNVLVEGGAGLAASFIEADLVDTVQAYVAPLVLGAGRGVLGHAVAHTLADAAHFERVGMFPLGDDVLLEYRRVRSK